MQLTLWEEKAYQTRKRSRKKARPRTPQTPYSIIGANDCEIIGHTLTAWDLLGCSTCIDCGVRVFCPVCTKTHPQDETAIALLCERHEQPKESQVSA